MKFYLTKAAQRAAESGQVPAKKEKVARAPKVAAEKAPKVARVHAEKVPSARRQRAAVAGPATSVAAPASPVVAPLTPSFAATPAPASAPATVAAPTQVFDAPTLAPVETAQGRGRGSRASKGASAPQAAPAKKEKKGVIAVGGQPRVDLLPEEVRAERKAGTQVRRAWLGVAAVVVLVGIGSGAATLYSQGANSSLAETQAQTSNLSQQALKYSPVKTTQGQVDIVQAAREVGGSTDVDWPQYLADVALTVPAGAQLSGVTVDSASPVVAYAQAQAPLEGQRVATLTLTATSSSLPSVPTWLNSLTKVKGYEDATAGTVALSSGVYTATVTLHINEKAFSNAYKKGN